MRRLFVIAAVALQVLALAFLAGDREWILRTGTPVVLRTAPIDPRDLFRGDYVRLRYDASVVPFTRTDASIIEQTKQGLYGRTVYAALAVGDDGLAEVTGLAAARPAAGLFLKGRTMMPWRFGIIAQDSVAVGYGIEAYYVQEGAGREIEKRQGTRTTVQTPLEMEVAVGGNGTAVIRGYRWSPLGIGLEAVESVRSGDATGRKSAKLRLTLQNTSERPLAIVNLPGMCSLVLEPAGGSTAVRVPARQECAGRSPADADVVLLQPNDARAFDIDLAEPLWQVFKDNAMVETGTLAWGERFRIVYRPPSREATAALRDAPLIWHGSLPSRAFHGRGNID